MSQRKDTLKQRIGFISQDVKKAIIESSSEKVSATHENFVKVKEKEDKLTNGVSEGIDDFHSFDYSRMVTILWSVVKSQKKRIDDMETILKQNNLM